jgi:N-acetylglutamate synthase-like GNAT family acetyltransferase
VLPLNNIQLCQPNISEFEAIKKLIILFQLDGRDAISSQFIIAKIKNEMIGFARIKKHKGYDEYCTLGVLEKYRKNNVASLITHAIIKKSTQPLFLVCIIPHYFLKLGFEIVVKYPIEIKNKLNYCISALEVNEKYVVMILSHYKL